MSNKNMAGKLAKIAKQRETLEKQVIESKNKMSKFDDELALLIGQLAVSKKLFLLDEDKLGKAFEAIAQEHKLL